MDLYSGMEETNDETCEAVTDAITFVTIDCYKVVWTNPK